MTNDDVNLEAKRTREQQTNDIRTVMSTEAGRRFVWRLIDRAGPFRKCFTGNSETFYNEGRREYGLFILAEVLDACPDMYAQAAIELNDMSKRKDRTNG